jgi:hypothetical protein
MGSGPLFQPIPQPDAIQQTGPTSQQKMTAQIIFHRKPIFRNEIFLIAAQNCRFLLNTSNSKGFCEIFVSHFLISWLFPCFNSVGLSGRRVSRVGEVDPNPTTCSRTDPKPESGRADPIPSLVYCSYCQLLRLSRCVAARSAKACQR